MRFHLVFLFWVLPACLFAQKQGPISYRRVHPGPQINTVGQEYAPVISADGSVLLFTARKLIGRKKDGSTLLSFETVFQSSFDTSNKKWSQALALEPVINRPERHNSAIALSNDGQRMLLYRDDVAGNGDIYSSELKGNRWSEPKSLGKPICSKYHESAASIAPNGRTIYFVSDRPGGVGGRDIWLCTANPEGKYQEVLNAGNSINSTADEEGVFIHPDGKTIYFSSDRPGGFGGFDLYRSELNGKNWSPPVNMGPEFNTGADEMYFVSNAAGNMYIISSAGKESLGMQDIFVVYSVPANDSVAMDGPALCLLKGMVEEEGSKHPLEATIEIVDNTTATSVGTYHSNSLSGNFLVSLPSGYDYGIRVSAPGYLFYSDNINIPLSTSYREVHHRIQLQKIETGKKVILKNIFYDFNKTELSAASKSELEHLLKLMNENPGIRIAIASHTDDVGSDEYNLKLSEGRAKSVVQFLTNQGIQPSRLVAMGYGEAMPLVPNDTPAHQAINRRTEFIILPK
ncbi:MAG: OmpA family protein [Bacteroidia bacterium]|nr:OmpA family protein [Bacteroidia bacterium]